MKAEPRKLSDGSVVYSFVHYEAGKRTRIPQTTIIKRFGQKITTKKKAEEALKILAAEYDSKRLRTEKRVEWEKEFYKIKELVDEYAVWQKKSAPNSYKNNVACLRYYVVPFFMVNQELNNIMSWFDHFEIFKDWLEDEAELITDPGRPLSFNYKNHCIKALNTFMKHLKRRRIIDKIWICESFPEHRCNVRGSDYIIPENEMKLVYNKLKSKDHELEATFFRFLWHTGLRYNEALGVSLNNFHSGKIESGDMQAALTKHGMETYHGYLQFDSQPSHLTRGLRDKKTNQIARKPLKGRKKIEDKSGRVIPISDKKLWNEIVTLYEKSQTALKSKTFGIDAADYPLFEGIDKSTTRDRTMAAFDSCGLEWRSFHAHRHTRSTLLMGKTRDYVLARLWLGHLSMKVFDRYCHVYEAINKEAKEKKTIQAGLQRAVD